MSHADLEASVHAAIARLHAAMAEVANGDVSGIKAPRRTPSAAAGTAEAADADRDPQQVGEPLRPDPPTFAGGPANPP
jgi:hypothetical protein